jgi:Fe-S-cluster containining protein
MKPKQIDLVQIRELAAKKEKENWRFREFLKGSDLEPEDIDSRVAEITERVWAGIDCTTCANCCRELQPTFSEEDVARVARRLGMDRQQFINTYLQKTEPGESNPWETRTTPCPFLKGNLCGVYEDRPGDCSDYPFLFKPDFVSRSWGTIERTFTCPIVCEVMEELKGSLRSEWQAYKRQ